MNTRTEQLTTWYAGLLRRQSPLPRLIARWHTDFTANLPAQACSAQGLALLHAGLGAFWPADGEILLLNEAFTAPFSWHAPAHFQAAPARVALLPPELVRRTALMAGAVCRRAELARCMNKASVTALREGVSEEARLFALRYGAAFTEHARLWLATLPDALRRWLAALPLPHSAAACGWLAVLACALAGGQRVAARLRCLLAALELSLYGDTSAALLTTQEWSLRCGTFAATLAAEEHPLRGNASTAPLAALSADMAAGAWPLVRVIIRKTCPPPAEYTWEQLFA